MKAPKGSKARLKIVTDASHISAERNTAEAVAVFLKWLKDQPWKLVGPISRMIDRTTFKCKTCGTTKEVSPFGLSRYGRSPRCYTCQFDAKVPSGYKRVSPYNGGYGAGTVRVKVKHLECGTVKEYEASSFTQGKARCTCLLKRRPDSRTTESVARDIRQARDKTYRLIGEYLGYGVKVEIQHLTCGATFHQSLAYFLNGNRCLVCEANPAKWTQETCQDWLNSESR